VPIVLNSGSLNLLQPSGPVQASNGSALAAPFALHVTVDLLCGFHKIFRHMAGKYVEMYDTLQYSALHYATGGRILEYDTRGIIVR
jgi:hypothetical protein